jgi:hypothetical protein
MRIRRELWFGFALMAIILAGAAAMLLSAPVIERGHLGLLMSLSSSRSCWAFPRPSR